jgi:hypothetical protein
MVIVGSCWRVENDLSELINARLDHKKRANTYGDWNRRASFPARLLHNTAAVLGGHWRIECGLFKYVSTRLDHGKRVSTYQDNLLHLLVVLAVVGPFGGFSTHATMEIS